MERGVRHTGSFILLAGMLGLTSSRWVHVPPGPLYRVEGTHISISCNVTDYDGAREQDFEWTVSKLEAPERAISVVSTRDPDFSYLAYRGRVGAGDVFIHRLAPDSVELHMRSLQKQDEGEFECYTPSNDRKYQGMYSAKVMLRVLPDTLHLSGPSDAHHRLAVREGEPLALLCRAAVLTAPHTHLSVTFVRDGSDGRQMVIGLGRDLTVETDGQGPYWARYAQGDIGVEKIRGNAYHLKVDHLKTQDAGSYHCTAAEWILDPDGTWQKILERTIPLVNLSVDPIDLTLGAKASVAPTMFYRGDTVDLHCNVSLGVGEEQEEVALSVGWWAKGEDALAGVDRRGVSLPTALWRRTAAGSELSADWVAPRCFRLRIYRATREDEGQYHCVVTCWARSPGRGWYQVARARSQPLTLYLYLSPSDTLLIPMVVGVVISLIVTVTIISSVTCCFLRRLAKK
uniref:immunoglobulin superfamily member 8 n=1 Tax=Pristiophorus japonicus TaxID=55135 RepID=UPI00398EA2F0